MNVLKLATLFSVAFCALTTFADVTDYVDPFIGTAIHNDSNLLHGGLGGNVHPGAAYPFGMLIWSPDTETIDSAIYEYTKGAITGFSLTHLSGPGCIAAGDFPILPVIDTNYVSAGYKHRNESAAPGYYGVTLENNIQVELTVNQRSGMGRFHFPSSGGNLVLNSSHIAAGKILSHVERVSDYEIIAWSETGYFCGAQNKSMLNLVLQSETPFTFKDLGDGRVALQYPGNTVAQIKVALSYVSVDGARNNLRREIPNWDFSQLRNFAREAWSKKLSIIEVESSDTDQTKIFYTALYHSLLHPNIISDVPNSVSNIAEYPKFGAPGEFYTYSGRISHAQQAVGYTQYANVSGWDTYRSQAQLLAWLYPSEASDMMKSLVKAAEQCGALPKWAELNSETNIMNGDPAATIIASSYAFGAKDFPVSEALKFMQLTALVPGTKCGSKVERPGLEEYMRDGYLPNGTPGVWGVVATSLEYNVADYSVAQLSKELGDTSSYNYFLNRSLNWKLNFDSTSQLPRQRYAKHGPWLSPFDSLSLDGFVEGNAEQYVWFVPHDAANLIQWLGGNATVVARLDHHFSKVNSGPTSEYFYIGNEPSFNTPWLYNYTNKPSHTQYHVRKIRTDSFTSKVDGLPGNDDLGATSSWYVWAALGLFPTIPGEAKLTLATPAFKKIVITLPNTKLLVLHAPDAPLVYIQGITLNGGTALNEPWLPQEMIFNGGYVNFTLGGSEGDSNWLKP